jgi:hypothetical protein
MSQSGKEKWEELYNLANDCYAKGMGFDSIKDVLHKKSDDDDLIYAVVKKVRSDHYSEIRKQGLTILAVGMVLILSGFIITCCNFYSNRSFEFAMYGLTSIGIIVVFWGLYKFIG